MLGGGWWVQCRCRNERMEDADSVVASTQLPVLLVHWPLNKGHNPFWWKKKRLKFLNAPQFHCIALI